jgi:plastocyanin
MPADADVEVGPGTELAFDPVSLTVPVGDTVTWWFASADHNVACDPAEDDVAELPDGAEPFASYDGDDRYHTEPEGTTFDHTFSTPGTYVYVCVPHIPHGMVGEIVVTE